MSSAFYIKKPADPLWRRVLMNLGLDLMNVGDRMHAGVDVKRITIRDRVAWKIEDLASAIFSLGYDGSDAEECSGINGEIPWIYMTDRQKHACEEFYGTPVPLNENGFVDNSVKEDLRS